MRTGRAAVAVFLLFFLGTVALFHVDRQDCQLYGGGIPLIEKVENFIEKRL